MKDKVLKNWRCNNIEKFKENYEYNEEVITAIVKYYESTRDFNINDLENEEKFMEVICEDVDEGQKFFIIKTLKGSSLDYKKFFK